VGQQACLRRTNVTVALHDTRLLPANSVVAHGVFARRDYPSIQAQTDAFMLWAASHGVRRVDMIDEIFPARRLD
jgi:hypothetical protein